MMKKTCIVLLLLVFSVASADARRNTVACRFAADGSQVYEDSLVVVRLTILPQMGACVEVHNKTASVLIVDRQLSFAYVNGESSPLYSASTVTDGVVHGSGTLEEFYNQRYINGHFHSHYITVTEQPVQAIAPSGTAVVGGWEALELLMDASRISIREHGSLSVHRRSAYFVDARHKQRMRRGDCRYYDMASTPLCLGVSIRYTTDSAPDAVHTAYVADYVTQIDVRKHVASDRYNSNLMLPSQQYLFDYGGVNVPAVATYGLTLAGLAAVIGMWSACDLDIDMPSGF